MTILHATPEKYQNKLYIITVKSFVENVIQSCVWPDLSIDKTKYIKGLRLQSFKPFDCDLFTLYWHFIFQHRSVPLCMGNHLRQIDSMELHSRNKLLYETSDKRIPSSNTTFAPNNIRCTSIGAFSGPTV